MTARPWVTIVVLLVVTVVLSYGSTLRAPPTEGASVAFLPPGHAIAEATRDIDEFFGNSGEVRIVTLIFRGDAITPEGLSQMDSLIGEVVSDQNVSELLVPVDAVVAPSLIIGGLAPLAEVLGRSVTRWPIPYLVVVIAITTGLGYASTDLK